MDETLMIFAPRVMNGTTVCVTIVSARTLRSTTRITSADDVEQVEADAHEFLLRELLGQLFELAHAAGDEPELFDVGKFAHELARELRAETGGRAGDDGRGHPRP